MNIATLSYNLMKNEMPATAEAAPYLGNVIPNGVVNLKEQEINFVNDQHKSCI